ncbi:choice-of-anchor Q domain-containing protein [Acuticoccus sediminis]|uniref:choice-of-anchor Q domain-containing protein n=1 Tax=Acuticoccus sediminis TaxID=2184697 RepID=UPI001CFD91F3|nr:choice-of-anchor Q domain-containing protein [Acuticoccus sediminis]
MLTLTVTTLADEVDGTGAEGVETADGDGLSLREALSVARSFSNDGAEVEVVFAPELAGQTLELEFGSLPIDFDVAIHGDALGGGEGDVTIYGGTQVFAAAGIFEITAGMVAIDNVRIEGAGSTPAGGADFPDTGYLAGVTIGEEAVVSIREAEIADNWYARSGGLGGGVRNAGTLDLTDVAVTGNGVGWGLAGGSGGGIANSGSLTMERVEVSGNVTSGRLAGYGAGIYNTGNLSADASLVAENTGGEGAALYNAGEAVFVNSTLALNSSAYQRFGYGSGIINEGDLTLIQSTVAGHTATRDAATEIENVGAVTLANSIVLDSDGVGVDNHDGAGTLTLLGGNIVGNAVYSGGTVNGTTNAREVFWNGVQLDDNGGPLRTINLRSSYENPSVDAGDPSVAAGADGAPLATDARGLARDVDIAEYGGGARASVDLGAVERPSLTGDLLIGGQSYRIRSFGEDQDEGTFAVSRDGSAITLGTDAWKETSTFRITADTVLSFDFSSTDEGEIHAIGFDTAERIDRDNAFQLLGTQLWGNQAVNGVAAADGEVTRFDIPVGALAEADLLGEFVDLVFITDDDAGGGSNSTFANVSLHEAGPAELELLLG